MLSLDFMAGYFDGEGCVTFSVSKGYLPQLLVALHSGDKEILDGFAGRFGGNVYPVKERSTSRRKRAQYHWTLTGRKGQAALRELVPYLVGKRQVAELALEFEYGTQGHKLSQEAIDKRFAIREQVSEINQRVTVH